MNRQPAALAGFVGLFLLTAAQSPSVVPASGIRYIRTPVLLAESRAAKSELEQIQQLQRQKAEEIRARQQSLEAVRGQLAQAPDVEARTRLAAEEKRLRTELEQATLAAQSEIQSQQRQLQAGLQAKIKVVLDEMLKNEDVAIVLNADTAVVWARPGLDLTPAVVAKLNAGPPVEAGAKSR